MSGSVRQYVLRRQDLLYPELSFKINGVLFDVFKQLGGNHQERYYQKAVAAGLAEESLPFRQQVYVPLQFHGQSVGSYFLDFLIADKVILELKRGKFVPARIIDQTKQYLSALGLKLALIACFTANGVVSKRIVNTR